MYIVPDKLKEKISNLSKDLKDRYEEVLYIERDELRSFIEKEIGKIISIEKLIKNH